MIYDIYLSTEERFEKGIPKFIRKWLGFHSTISSLTLYSKRSPNSLLLTSLTSLFKTTKASSLLQLRDSSTHLFLTLVRSGKYRKLSQMPIVFSTSRRSWDTLRTAKLDLVWYPAREFLRKGQGITERCSQILFPRFMTIRVWLVRKARNYRTTGWTGAILFAMI